jgi:parallel beta-helix repeat protein
MRGSRFDDLIIEHCHVERTDRNGICQRGHGGPRSTRIIIRNNRLENIGGDGIKLWGTNGGLIEHNTVRNARARCQDHAAGIWPFDSDDTTIQFNTVSHTRGTLDGQSFDSDYHCRRTLIQYNVSHNNEGGFLLVCAPGRAPNQDTIVRYNISVHDGVNTARVIHFGGGSDRTLIHNNTFILGPNQQLPMLLFTDWDGGKARNARFSNNLVIVERGGIAKYDFGPSTGTLLENNLFVGRHEGLPQGITAVPSAPPIASKPIPSENPDWLQALRPLPNRDFPRGKIIENPGTRDFFGTPLPPGKPLAIGAAEPRP